MPPPSPPPTITSLAGSPSAAGAKAPPPSTPFASARDIANATSTRRHGATMSISSMLGGNEDRRPPPSPSSALTQAANAIGALRPPSPGRARAASMREQYFRPYRNASPGRGGYHGDGPDFGADQLRPLRGDPFGAPVHERDSTNGFRPFYGPAQQDSYNELSNGYGLPGRPSSQPSGQTSSLLPSETRYNDEPGSGRVGVFRTFGDHYGARDSTARADFVDRTEFRADRDGSAITGLPTIRDERRAVYPGQQSDYLPRDSIESRPFAYSRPGDVTPPAVSYADQYGNGYHDRPLTYEEHQRLESAGRDYPRKDSDGYAGRSLFNISPEVMRRGRDSPLPQAVQGARPRHIGPGSDYPGIKSEFGRMFSGLGSGATPVAGQSANGSTTPSRLLSPSAGDQRPLYDHEDGRSASAVARLGRKQSRKSKDEPEELYDGRLTPSLSARGGKRAKTAHPLHHHHHHHHHAHHHHHEAPDQHVGSYGMIRFPSNSTPQQHRYHHHHHAHPVQHHHHHAQRSLLTRKPTVSIHSDAVLKSVADMPRKHLGSMPYYSTASKPSLEEGDRIAPYENKSSPLPRFDGKENCLFTVRVPKWILNRTANEIANGDVGRFEEICRRRHVWGSDVYTDDSDVVAAAVHAGWIRGDFGAVHDELQAIDDDDKPPQSNDELRMMLDSRPARPAPIPDGYDMHITVVILPPLQGYAGSHKHHVLSRDWLGGAPHDGMSLMVHRIEFVVEGDQDRGVGRDAKSRKARMSMEEQKRRDAAAILLSLPSGAGTVEDSFAMTGR